MSGDESEVIKQSTFASCPNLTNIYIDSGNLFSDNRKCIQLFLSTFPFPLTFTMNFYAQELKLNLLPPDKLYCDFNYWSSLFTQDMSILWEIGIVFL